MTSQCQYTQTDEQIIKLSEVLEKMFSTMFVKLVVNRSCPAQSEDSDLCVHIGSNPAAICASIMSVEYVLRHFAKVGTGTKNPTIKIQMQCAADEEIDRLAWCEQRIEELGGRKSWLTPFWYAGVFVIGTVAGIARDK